MLFSLDVLRARKGDCLLLHYGSKENPHLIVIDGGPSKVYKPHLLPRIVKVHKARGLGPDEPLPVEVIMVSHVDDDHIKGILELAADQRDQPSPRLEVGSLWHNSFDDLLNTKPEELEAGFGSAAVGSGDGDSMSVLASAGKEGLDGRVEVENEDQFQTAQVLASIAQGRQLRDEAESLNWRINRKFKGALILASADSKPVTLDGDLKITVVGPMQPELVALQKAHDDWLRQQKKKKKKSAAAAILAAFADKSVPNLSSLVLLAEFEKKKILLTGDARGDKILQGLKLKKLLPASGSMRVHVLKVPHHGSQNNMETVFFKKVIADHYVFSGDGEHGNPERETLEMLLAARKVSDAYTIHLTYPVADIDKLRKEDWKKEQAKERKRKKKKVRENWSDAKHSLAALFDQNPKFADKVRIVDDKKPHSIDLLDNLGF